MWGIMDKLTSLCVIAILCIRSNAFPSEPMCSKFDYELKTIETMLRTEQNVEKMMDKMKIMQETVTTNLDEMKAFEIKVSSDFEALAKNTKEQISDQITQLNDDSKLLTTIANDNIQKMDGALQQTLDKDLNVAFSVTNPTRSLVNGVPIFSTTITNVGGAYNMDTGVFTSPVDGLYMFLFTVGSSGKHNVYCRIQHNGSNKVFGGTNSDNSYTTASASVVLILTKGDTVLLGDCYGWTNVYHSSRATTFSGALLKKTIKQ